MPIIDYKARANKWENTFFNSNSISQKNKLAVRRFLDIYMVSDARRAIFFANIDKFLSRTEDVERDMHDSGRINKIFKELRDSYSTNYYATIVNVSNRLVTWLNEGVKPKGFKDVRNVPRRSLKRRLNPSDMHSWDDGQKFISGTNNIQLKAIFATQLDGGFRPSEFVDLDYGDITVKDQFIVANVKGGKTGGRLVILWRAVPYLLRWLKNHPTQRKTDPLWIMERAGQNSITRYGYAAIKKRISELGKKLKIRKPTDFYSLRHSACAIAKMDNVPEELAAAKFGHSVDYYVNTYGRLSPEDMLNRYSKHYGIKAEAAKRFENVVCPRCQSINEPEANLCENCGSALGAKAAFQAFEENLHMKDELSSLKGQLERINSFMESLVDRNPEVIDILARKVVKEKEPAKSQL